MGTFKGGGVIMKHNTIQSGLHLNEFDSNIL